MTANTDVDEYGKRLLEEILTLIDIEIIDGGVSTDPKSLAAIAVYGDAIFLSTYNGIALDFWKHSMKNSPSMKIIYQCLLATN